MEVTLDIVDVKFESVAVAVELSTAEFSNVSLLSKSSSSSVTPVLG